MQARSPTSTELPPGGIRGSHLIRTGLSSASRHTIVVISHWQQFIEGNPMSTLILVFHPHLKDGSRVNARLLAELTAQGEDDIIVRDEYAEYPNLSVNADTEHELEAADRVILQFRSTGTPPPRCSRNGKTRSSPQAGPGGPRTQGQGSSWWSPLVPTPPSTARMASTATPWRSC